tara:strand:- start:1336 stop:2988 length:1653 start_codon:yes stop_codon:yes gene_type:complete
VGIYFGTLIGERTCHTVHFLCHDAARARDLRLRGVRTRLSDGGVVAIERPSVHASAADVPACDVVLLCTKQPVPHRAELAPLGEDAAVLPLANGIEHVRQADADYGVRALAGCARIVVDSPSLGEAVQYGPTPSVTVGALGTGATDDARVVAGVLRDAGIDTAVCVEREDACRALWKKFAFITAVSAIGAATDASLQEVHACDATRELLAASVDEATAVARAHGYPISGLRDEVTALATARCEDQALLTFSLQRDVRRGRPSELDAQLGAMLRLAAARGVSVPTLKHLHATLAPRELRLRHRTPTNAEAQARSDLAACHRLLDRHGMSDLFVTHVSLRIPDTDAFLLTPYGVLFSQVTPECLVKVRMSDGTRLDNGAEVFGITNYTACMIHAPLQRAGHAAVVHTHTAAGNAVASARDGLLPLNQKAMVVLPFLREHPYDALALATEEGDVMARALATDLSDDTPSAPARVLLLRNHGLLAVGATIGEAFLWCEWMECACRFQVASAPPYAKVDDTMVKHVAEQSKRALGPGSQNLWSHPRYWQALLESL